MMRLPFLIFLLLAVPASAVTIDDPAPSSDALIGTWDVSLYFSPDQPPSSTVMTISSTEGGVLKGTFYSTEFSVGRVRVHNDELIFTAVTEDGSGPYLHSGRLRGGVIEGQTLSTGRDFLMAWDARKAAPEEE